MAYKVTLGNILFPVTPAKIQMKIKNQNKTLNLINEGDVNVLKDAGLTEISFSALLPNQKYSFAQYYDTGYVEAGAFLVLLERCKQGKKPLTFNIIREIYPGKTLHSTSMVVSLEEYEIEDDASAGFDTKVNIKLKLYKKYGTKTVNLSTGASSKNRSEGEGANNSGKSYKIVSGDTLWGIAKKKLGSGIKWKEIYNANKTVIENAAKKHGRSSSQNGHWIYPGTTITIP